MVRSLDLDLVAPDDVVAEKIIVEIPKIEKLPNNQKNRSTTPKDEIDKKMASFRQKIYDVLGHTNHSFSSLLVKPHFFKFQEQDDEEEIILVMRPHWFTNVSWTITTLFMLMVPSLIKYIPVWNGVAFRYQFLGILFWYMVTLAFALEKFLSWYFDVYIITDERVVDIEFNNLLDKKFAEAKISMIQDVSSRVAGISQTIFNYGDVRIQTAAEIPELCFENVPSPDKVIKVLQMMRQEEEQEAIDGRVR
ncbi:MAG: PH domain-containing protein [Candidatus Shapirobacteria bacterium]